MTVQRPLRQVIDAATATLAEAPDSRSATRSWSPPGLGGFPCNI
jgi:hypothetical protein